MADQWPTSEYPGGETCYDLLRPGLAHDRRDQPPSREHDPTTWRDRFGPIGTSANPAEENGDHC